MLDREILIVNSKDQGKYRIITNAATLGELQDAIIRNENVYRMVDNAWVSNTTPMSLTGLDFTEGITKTKLVSRDSLLPTNVPFKGQTTNNLVMLLTNTTKQIASGATTYNRKDLYAEVKRLNLQDSIKELYGKNYTMVGNVELKTAIDAACNRQEVIEAPAAVPSTSVEEYAKKPLPDVKSAPHAEVVEWAYTGIKTMVKNYLLCAEDVVVIASLTQELAARLLEEKPEITSDDLDDMLNSIC